MLKKTIGIGGLIAATGMILGSGSSIIQEVEIFRDPFEYDPKKEKKKKSSPFSVSGRRPEAPIPKGCKLYFFDQDGAFSTNANRKDLCVFKCIAVNERNAKNKFNKWKASESQ
jgi:hypothetical protein